MEDLMSNIIHAPAADEYAPYYAQYVERVPSGDIFAILSEQILVIQRTLGSLSEAESLYRYAPGAWSIKEVVGHLCDAERVFAYRAYAFAHKDPNPLPSFDQEDYVREAHYDQRPLADLIQEFSTLRRATVLSFQSVSSEISQRRGIASDATVSVRALLYIMAGHVYQHLESFHTDYLLEIAQSDRQHVH
jgi:hypothetical protein